MSAEVIDLELSGLRLPENRADLKRHRFGKAEHHDAAYDARYDWSTIFYDCFFDEAACAIVLLGPPLLNLRPLIEAAEFRVDGRAVEIREIRDLSRCSIVALEAAEGRTVTVTHGDFGGQLVVGRSFVEDFAGLNGVQSISLDNRLEWISDWLTYHVKAHGLETVVLTDNGSTAYAPDALRRVLSSVPGLRKAAIMRARYPFGPTAENRSAYNSLFLQRSMAEMGRLRFFAKARALLNADIDELFHSFRGQSVFDATVASADGYVRADAEWVYVSKRPDRGFARHADHSHVSVSGKPKANRKWCIAPLGPLKEKQWKTHFIHNRKDPVDPDFRMWHFRQISTSWKCERTASGPDLVQNPDLMDAMRRVLPSES
ncbi:MAG: hypothetical protein AAFP13_13240 [Pseudomonadota bacterium]